METTTEQQKLYNLVADGWGDPDSPCTLADLQKAANYFNADDDEKAPVTLRENHRGQIIDDDTYEIIATPVK